METCANISQLKFIFSGELLQEVRDLKSIIEANEQKIATTIEDNNVRMSNMLDEFRNEFGGGGSAIGSKSNNSSVNGSGNNLRYTHLGTTIKQTPLVNLEGTPSNNNLTSSNKNAPSDDFVNNSSPASTILNPNNGASNSVPPRYGVGARSSNSFLARRTQSEALFEGGERVPSPRSDDSEKAKLTSSVS